LGENIERQRRVIDEGLLGRKDRLYSSLLEGSKRQAFKDSRGSSIEKHFNRDQ
jgi:hypothetical protein